MVLWTAGTKPAGSGDRKLKVRTTVSARGSLAWPRHTRPVSTLPDNAVCRNCGAILCWRVRSRVLWSVQSLVKLISIWEQTRWRHRCENSPSSSSSLLPCLPAHDPHFQLQRADGARRTVQLPFDLNSRGAAETDATLRVRKHSRVFALGDVSGIDPLPADSALPATAQVTKHPPEERTCHDCSCRCARCYAGAEDVAHCKTVRLCCNSASSSDELSAPASECAQWAFHTSRCMTSASGRSGWCSQRILTM